MQWFTTQILAAAMADPGPEPGAKNVSQFSHVGLLPEPSLLPSRISIGRILESESKPGIKARSSDTGYGHLNH